MVIKGNNDISLRVVEESDAGFIFKLRTDSDLNKHISSTSGTIEDQVAFIKKYKEREVKKIEYYFIIDYKETAVGTLRIYNIDYEKSTFTWGSWIIERGNPGEVALSSAYMSYFFGFEYLNLQKALIDVRKENKKASDFYNLYCNFLYEDELNYYLDFNKSEMNRYVDKFKNRIPSEVVSYE
jgi:RimJ/RimL family protein N-acetyltransferase